MHTFKSSLLTLRIFSVFVMVCSVTALAAPAIGAELIDSEYVGSMTGLGTATPVEIAGTIISVVLGLLGLIAVCIIIYSGFTWMTAGGNDDKVKESQDRLKAAVIGLLIIMSSYGIALFLFSALEQSTGYEQPAAVTQEAGAEQAPAEEECSPELIEVYAELGLECP